MFAPENLVSRDGFGSPVPGQPAHLHTQLIWYLLTRFLPSSTVASICLFKPSYAIGSVPSLSGHAIAYRWRSLRRARRHKASKSQGGSERVLPWQVTMDQLICASISHIHYWYGVGMLKVPAKIILPKQYELVAFAKSHCERLYLLPGVLMCVYFSHYCNRSGLNYNNLNST